VHGLSSSACSCCMRWGMGSAAAPALAVRGGAACTCGSAWTQQHLRLNTARRGVGWPQGQARCVRGAKLVSRDIDKHFTHTHTSGLTHCAHYATHVLHVCASLCTEVCALRSVHSGLCTTSKQSLYLAASRRPSAHRLLEAVCYRHTLQSSSRQQECWIELNAM